MKLADQSDEFCAYLAKRYRYGRFGNPSNGDVWNNERGVCSICSMPDSFLMDHCHSTGFQRGWLCTGCNNAEGRRDDVVLDLWRLTAPLLADRTLYVSSWTGQAKPQFLNADELAFMPMADLLRLSEERWSDWQQSESRRASLMLAARLRAS